MKERQEIGKQFLNSILESLKKRKRIEGFAINWLEQIIEISYLNDFRDLMEDGLKLRNSKSDENYCSSKITNFILSSKSNNYRLPTDKLKLEKKYSYDQVIDFLKIIANSKEGCLQVKSHEEVEEAIKKARDDFDLEIIACPLVINGDFDGAQRMIENELSEFEYRIKIIKTVMCIEYFRRNEIDKGKQILNGIYPKKDSYWENLFLARGILGYEPWGGYPNSDY